MTDEQPEFTPEEKAKAQRAIMILYIVMIVFVALPFVVMLLVKE